MSFYIADKTDVDEKGEPLRGREPWRKNVSLGSKLCSKADIVHRCILANVAFEKYSKVWLEKSRISLYTKVKLYEALVTPVLLYNCNSWAAPEKILQKVDVCQRNHLRQIMNCTYPRNIRNKDLYARCGVTPLTERVAKSRWKMLGHILRSDCNSPPQLALSFTVKSMGRMRGLLDKVILQTLSVEEGRSAGRYLQVKQYQRWYCAEGEILMKTPPETCSSAEKNPTFTSSSLPISLSVFTYKGKDSRS
ncbi:hypothetical protein ACHWQZ_G019137 [Mnemiopsis leidyi]